MSKHLRQRKSNKYSNERSSRHHAMRDIDCKGKVREINNALDSDPVDVPLLRKLAISQDGLVNNDLRCKVWPKLLNLNIFDLPTKQRSRTELEDFIKSSYWTQVNLDINRCHRRLPAGIRAGRRKMLQKQLTCTIMRVLCRNPDLHYYQGYHDIAVTLLLVTGEDLATAILEQLSLHHIRDFMDKNMERTNRMLALIHPIVGKVDETLETFLDKSEVGQIFALSWLITWFGHNISSFEVIVRLFDFFIATNPTMPIYVGAALIKFYRNEVLATDCDMSAVHHLLCKLPLRITIADVEELISAANELYKEHPPKSLQKEVLKFLKQSASLARHLELLQNSLSQKPDSVLRKRRMLGQLLYGNERTFLHTSDLAEAQLDGINPSGVGGNPLVKAAVWTLTLSMGAMTFIVLNAAQRWF